MVIGIIFGTATFTDRDAAERRLKRLNDQNFEPCIVEYNLKEN